MVQGNTVQPVLLLLEYRVESHRRRKMLYWFKTTRFNPPVMLPPPPETVVLPTYVQSYIRYVCPLRPKTCKMGMHVRAPPIEIQRARLEYLETLPEGLRGLTLELLDEGKVDEVAFVETHKEDFKRFVELFENVPDDPTIEPPNDT